MRQMKKSSGHPQKSSEEPRKKSKVQDAFEIFRKTHDPGNKVSGTKPLAHPFFCRIRESEGFSVASPQSLIGAGFASISLAFFSFFRPTPALLLAFTTPDHPDWDNFTLDRNIIWGVIYTWGILLFIVLVGVGLLLVGSTHIRTRWILMLHPWGLMLLYLDVFVWISLTIALHLHVTEWPKMCPVFTGKIGNPVVYFTLMYFETLCFAALYYIYSTFFIAAELTVIERFYP